MATIEELLGRSNEELAKLTDEDITNYVNGLTILEPIVDQAKDKPLVSKSKKSKEDKLKQAEDEINKLMEELG